MCNSHLVILIQSRTTLQAADRTAAPPAAEYRQHMLYEPLSHQPAIPRLVNLLPDTNPLHGHDPAANAVPHNLKCSNMILHTIVHHKHTPDPHQKKDYNHA